MSSIDVIVPCYRYGHFLHECVQSVLTQSIEHVRVLIIDDASPDNTAEIASDLAKSDGRVKFLRHSANKGHISTYNEGIEWASAEYMLILSADDYLLPGALSRAVQLMIRYPEVGLTFGKAIDITEGGELNARSLSNTTVDALVCGRQQCVLSGCDFLNMIARVKSVNVVRTPTAIVRTELQKRLGGYRHELPHSGDLEMWLRFASHSFVGVLAEYQAAYRFHGRNMQVAYFRSRLLPDLEQRKAAIDFAAAAWEPVLPEEAQFRRKLLRPLAREAVARSINAFGDGDLDLSRKLSVFAISADPQITRTLEWLSLACRRRVGIRGWRRLRSALAWVR